MKYKIPLICFLLLNISSLSANTVKAIEPTVKEVLKAFEISSWKFEVDIPENKSGVYCKMLYYSRNKKGNLESKTLRVQSMRDETKSTKKITVGVYQKDDDITFSIGNVKTSIKLDTSDLNITFAPVDTDIKDEIILKVKISGNRIDINKKDTWDKYLALKIEIE